MSEHDNKTKKTLRFSLFDGLFASMMVGFTQEYFAPFLLAMGAGTGQIGLLSAFPNLAASLAQLKSADMVEHQRSRRRIINAFVFLQAMMFIPMALIAFLGRSNINIFIASVVFFTAFGAISAPPWSSLMSDLVHKTRRGSFFGRRNMIFGFVVVSSMLTAGFILQCFKIYNVYYGFAVLFACAFVFRLISLYFLTRMHEPPLEHKKGDRFTIFHFLFRARESNFVKFTIFIAVMNFSVSIAAPFFSVLMIRDMHFNYILYSCITMASTLMIYLAMGRWGVLADKVGNIRVIRLVAPCVTLIPLSWVICRYPPYLFVVQILSGIAWSGLNLCASNFIFDAVTPEKRTRCIAYYSVLNGLSMFLGPVIGGFLIVRAPALFGYPILAVFVLSSVLRAITAFSMLNKIKEVKTVRDAGNIELWLGLVGIGPLARSNN